MIAGLCTAGCITASVIMEQQATIVPIVGMAAATVLGGMFPDIDIRTSKISKRMKLTSRIISSLFGHRGFLHSPLFIGLVYLICLTIFQNKDIMQYSYIYVGFCAGFVMHLFCDMATKGGIPLLYPFYRKRFRFGVFESGHKFEWISLTFICVLTIALTGFLIWNGVYLGAIFPT